MNGNIDRKFMSLGFKAVFLNGEFARHIGEGHSIMVNKRLNEGTTPETYYPPELQADRIYPKLDYWFLDHDIEHPNNITIITAMVDIDRDGRDFEEHYMDGLKKLLPTRHPLVVYCEKKYFDPIRQMRGDLPTSCIEFDKSTLDKTLWFTPIKLIISEEKWYAQSEWMKESVIRNPYYIPLTLHKHFLLLEGTKKNPFGSKYFYWIDSGIFSSYHIQENINDFYFAKTPRDQFFMTTFPYHSDSEMHGYNMKGMEEICGNIPKYVCRATYFGGTKEQIQKIFEYYHEEMWQSISGGYIGNLKNQFIQYFLINFQICSIYGTCLQVIYIIFSKK